MNIHYLYLNAERLCLAAIADSFFLRLRGMIGREFNPFGAMVIIPCNQIHTYHMQFPIDAVFLDKEGKVVGILENIAPNKRTKYFRSGRYVVEMPAGAIKKYGITLDDRMTLTIANEVDDG